MDNAGHIKTYEVTAVELATGNENGIAVHSGEDLSTGAFVIWCSLNDQELSSSRDTYFLTFQKFRDKLLDAGYGLKCNGSRLNAVSSSMRESGAKVYLVEPGTSAQLENLVNIWDKADISVFPDSKQQNKFYDQWKAVEDRKLRKVPLAVKLLILIPVIPNIVWILAFLIRSPNIGIWLLIYGFGFSTTAGLLMLIIGTVIAVKKRNTPYIIAGFIQLAAIQLCYIFLFLAVFYGGVP